MPVARAAVGCVVVGLLLLGLILLVRPLIFSLAPPRGDDAVAVATVGNMTEPQLLPIVLLESHGLDGEVEAPDGHVEVRIVVAPVAFGSYTVVNAASPIQDNCPIQIAGESLVDCEGRRWHTDGSPLDPGLPPLQRFAAEVDAGAIIVDMTRPL
jgi:hypothetical protein